MRKYIYIVIGIVSLSCLAMVSGEEEDVITWNKNRPLTWNDYRGKPQRRFAAASTVYSLHRYIDKEDDKDAVAYIRAYFFCRDSWKKDDWINDVVLAHEQKHFDIVELYARKLRKQFSEMRFANYKEADRKLDSLYHVISEEMDVYQDKYDEETDYSMNGKQQDAWIKKIDSELEVYNKYQNTQVPVKYKSGN